VNVFLDTNVLLDVLMRRTGFCDSAAVLWELAHRRLIAGHVAAISFNNIYYVLRRTDGQKRAREALRLLRDTFEIVAVDHMTINQSINSPVADFEDAIQYQCALRTGAAYLITRNSGHFPAGGPAVVSPPEFLQIYGSTQRSV